MALNTPIHCVTCTNVCYGLPIIFFIIVGTLSGILKDTLLCPAAHSVTSAAGSQFTLAWNFLMHSGSAKTTLW